MKDFHINGLSRGMSVHTSEPESSCLPKQRE